MTITATPTLVLADVTVGLAGTTGALLAVDGLSFTWGRGSVLDQPTPATAELTVLDRTTGAALARRTDLIGQPVVIGWAGSDGSSGVSFRGRVTDVDVAPRAAGGWLVALAASSIEVDLGNYRIPAGTVWPAESYLDRMSRVVALLPAGPVPGVPALLPGSIALPAAFIRGAGVDDLKANDGAVVPAAQLDVSNKTALEVLRALYGSLSPQPMVYDPQLQRITYAPRRIYRYAGWTPGMTTSTGLTRDPAGLWRLTSADGFHLAAADLEYSGELTQTIDTALTRVEATWLQSGASSTIAQPTAAATREAVVGRRVMSVDTMHGSAGGAIRLATGWADVIDHEATLPRLGALGYSTARAPFADAAHARLLLAGCESGAGVYVTGSWLPKLAQRPMLGILGATVRYAGGVWSITATPTPVDYDPVPYSRPRTPPLSSVAAGIRLRDVDPALTFRELAYLDLPPGRTAAAATPYRGNPT